MIFVDLVSRIVFGLASVALMLLAGGLMIFAGSQVLHAFRVPEMSVGSTLLDAVGYTIIAIAVFDVAKYLLEEEAVRGREMRRTGEARRSMTKFISTIAIAVFLEALVSVFQASKEDMTMMLYPTLLLFGGVALVVGLGVYQRLSAGAEREMGGPQEEARAEEQEKKENDEESPVKKKPSRRAKSA